MSSLGENANYSQNLFVKLVVAAATEDNYNCKDDDPGAVIIKDMAKAVVVHYVFLQSRFARCRNRLARYYNMTLWNFG